MKRPELKIRFVSMWGHSIKRVFTDDRCDGMSSESKRSIHWCRTIQSFHRHTEDEVQDTAFYRLPSRRTVLHDKTIQVLTGTLKRHLVWEGFSVSGWGYTCGRGLWGGSDSLIHHNKHRRPGESHTSHDCSDLRESSDSAESTVFQSLQLVIIPKPHLNDLTWF